MTSSPATVVTAFLVSQGYATKPSLGQAWPCSIGTLPDTPDNHLALADYGGVLDGRQMSGTNIKHPLIQVRVRATDYNTAYQKALDIQTLLETVKNTSVMVSEGAATLISATLTSPLMYMGQEEKNRRQHFTINIQVTI